jgi:hypothetical protein
VGALALSPSSIVQASDLLGSPLEDDEDLYAFEPRAVHYAGPASPTGSPSGSPTSATSGIASPPSLDAVSARGGRAGSSNAPALPFSRTAARPLSTPSLREEWAIGSGAFVGELLLSDEGSMHAALIAAAGGAAEAIPLAALTRVESSFLTSGIVLTPAMRDRHALIRDVANEDLQRLVRAHPHAFARLAHASAAGASPAVLAMLRDMGARATATIVARMSSLASHLGSDTTDTGGEMEAMTLSARVDAVARADAKAVDSVAARRTMGSLRLGPALEGPASPLPAARGEEEGADGPTEALLEELVEEAIDDMLASR